MRPMRTIGRFWRDHRGVSAVEFALILPFLMAFLLGFADVASVLSVQRRLQAATSAFADIATQDPQLTTTELTDLYAAVELILAPEDPEAISMVLTSIVSDSKNRLSVDWSAARRASPRGGLSDNPIPDGLVPAGNSVILAEVTVNYEGGFGHLLPAGMTLSDTFVARPRRSARIVRSN